MAFNDPTIHRVFKVEAELTVLPNNESVTLTLWQHTPNSLGKGKMEIYFDKAGLAARFAAAINSLNEEIE